MQNRVITISRQYASGGRQIGERLAERLGIPFYDKQILALAAKQSGVAEDFFVQPERDASGFRDFSIGVFYELPLSDKIYLARNAAIRTLADAGPCVIVGCGGGGALKDTVPLLNVFIYADLEIRKRRATREYGDCAHKIEEHIATIDKKRAAFFQFYSGVNGRQMKNYHLCIDSGFSGIDGAVTMIETAYLGKIREAEQKICSAITKE